MPIGSGGSPVFISGRLGIPNPMTDFITPQLYQAPPRYRISGVTRDASLNPLGSCTVNVYEAGSGPSEPHGQLRGSTVSDASGNYSLDVTVGLNFQVVSTSSDGTLVGATVNTLQGV